MTGVKQYFKDSGHTSGPTSRINEEQRMKELPLTEISKLLSNFL
jgi:hypothetical protein